MHSAEYTCFGHSACTHSAWSATVYLWDRQVAPARSKKMNLWISVVGGYITNTPLLISITSLCIFTVYFPASSAVVFQTPCPSTEPSLNVRVIKTYWLEYFRVRALLNSVCPKGTFYCSQCDTCGHVMTVRHWSMPLFGLYLQAGWEKYDWKGAWR